MELLRSALALIAVKVLTLFLDYTHTQENNLKLTVLLLFWTLVYFSFLGKKRCEKEG